jgi:zinc transporter ZupT
VIEHAFVAVIMASSLACVVTTIGIYIISQYEAWGRGNIDDIEEPTLGLLLAISAGTLVYVGASHLLPEVEKENKRFSIISLAVGVLVAMFIVLSKR